MISTTTLPTPKQSKTTNQKQIKIKIGHERINQSRERKVSNNRRKEERKILCGINRLESRPQTVRKKKRKKKKKCEEKSEQERERE